ncbi:MAG TPA: acyl-CoA dehydrogenase family protein [Acidimicrobiales bacterium]
MTPAIGILMAQQLGTAHGPHDLGTIAAYRARCQGERIAATVSAAWPQAERILVDIGRDELLIGSPAAFSQAGTQPLDPACVNLTAELGLLDHLVIDELHVRRLEADRLARLAAAHEILGVSEQLMHLAVNYARDRKQFGAPIGSFQAVQQMLAAAEVELVGLRNCCDVVMRDCVRSVEPDPAQDAVLVKALAGRVSRRVSQSTLQTLGAIGFTWEHDHHRYQRRALTLDALFGSYHELVAQLGALNAGKSLRRVGVL